jgi:hypothetical protein
VDPEKKKTLLLMEAMLPTLDEMDRAHHVIFLIEDYIDDGDLVKARSLIRLMPPDYVDFALAADSARNICVREAVIVIIETFGTDWTLLGKATATA